MKQALPLYMQTNTMFSQVGFLPFTLLSFYNENLLNSDFDVMNIAECDPEKFDQGYQHHPLTKHDGRIWSIIAGVQEEKKPASIRNHIYLFTDLYENEKDMILSSFYDEELFASAYDYPEYQNEYWHERRHQELLDDNKYMRSSLLTTKPILTPATIDSSDMDAIKRYLYQDIMPYRFQSEFLSEEVYQMISAVAPHLEYELYPTQFVAIRQEGKLERLYAADDPLHENPRVKINHDPDSLMQQGSEEYWVLGCASIYNFTRLGIAFDIQEAARFLQETEQHFIDPFYKKDPLLAMLDEKFSILPDFRPTHYAHLDNKKLIRSELIRHMGPN